MNTHTRHSRLGLISRNEGKIKSYESCSDVRAWSHDLAARDRYLREWIKSDMPVCIIPISTIAAFLGTMTYKNRGKVTPRCHPNCKSRVVLESICTSCHAMKDCLKNDSTFEKYFEEEEFETCNWPCERCLDALKSIKMFWKVIVDKVFRVRVPKNEECPHGKNICSDSVRSTAKSWQTEMVHQAWLVNNLKPFHGHGAVKGTCQCRRPKSVTLDPRISTSTFQPEGSNSTKMKNGHFVRSNMAKLRENDPILLSGDKPHRQRNAVSRYISVKVKTVDVGCETCDLQKDNEECVAYMQNLNILQQRYNVQKTEVERLKRENTSLKFELQNFYNGLSMKSHLCTPAALNPINETVCLVPKPFDCVEDSSPEHSVQNVDSEMIITMKNCQNSSYRHISLLQVLHKSKEPDANNRAESACRREDPINLLAKMQDVFGAIVRREISIVNDKKRSRTKVSDIDASFHRVTVSRSAPSCSTLGTRSKASLINCAWAQGTKK